MYLRRFSTLSVLKRNLVKTNGIRGVCTTLNHGSYNKTTLNHSIPTYFYIRSMSTGLSNEIIDIVSGTPISPNKTPAGSLGTEIDKQNMQKSSLAGTNSDKPLAVNLALDNNNNTELNHSSVSVNQHPNATKEAPASLSLPPPTESDPTPSKPEPSLSLNSPIIRGVLWFDNVYPMRAHFLDPRHLFVSHEHESLMPQIMDETMKNTGKTGSHIEILQMIPRMKEGGVFLRFECPKSEQWKSAADVAESVIVALKKKPRRALLTPRSIQAHLVKGEPFMEDLLSRFPATRLKIEMKGSTALLSELTLEHLYGELRAFGQIYDLVLAPFNKDQARVASVQFRSMHSAVGVRNCLHRYKLKVAEGEVVLYNTYDSVLKTSVVTDFFVKHPRIVVPLLGLLFALFTYLIFDPLRTFNIKNKITQRFSWKELISRGPLPWLRQQFDDMKNSKLFDSFRQKQTKSKISSWNSRQQDEERVNKWLHSIPDRVLFLTGPKGAGKQSLVKKIVSDRKNVIKLDVSHLMERSDEEFVKGLAEDLGFAPGFAFLNFVGNIMDVFTPGASKATSTTQATQQVSKILEVTAHALEQIRNKNGGIKMINTTTGDVIVKEHKEKKVSFENAQAKTSGDDKHIEPQDPKQAKAQFDPNNADNLNNSNQDSSGSNKHNDHINSTASNNAHNGGGTIIDELPLFVIDGFTPDNKDKHNNFMNELVNWAGEQTATQQARFLFLTDSTLEESISKQLPDVKMSEVVLSDASVESALEFVQNSVGYEMGEQEQNECREAVQIIGGRYNDLLTLVRQIESGSKPKEAKEEIIQQSMAIVKSILFSEDKTIKWSRVQLWQTMMNLAVSPSGAALYDDILFNVFLGEDAGLRGLIRADLLRIENIDGDDLIRAGSPVYLESFRRMGVSDKLKPGMDLQVAKYYINAEQDKINKYEEELNKLASVQAQLNAAGSRVHDNYMDYNYNTERSEVDYSVNARRIFLLKLISDSHEKMHKFDEQRRVCEKKIKQLKVIKLDSKQNNS